MYWLASTCAEPAVVREIFGGSFGSIPVATKDIGAFDQQVSDHTTLTEQKTKTKSFSSYSQSAPA